MFCTRCHHDNPPGAHYCANCGNPLDAAETPAETTSTIALGVIEEHADEAAGDETGAGEGLLPGTAMLVVRRGPNAGSRFLLDRDLTTAGRHPDSDIFLDDVTVSRRHAEFRRTAEGFSVRDVGSLNGTYLNRERIESRELSGGDEVQVGKFRLVYLAGPRREGS